MRFPFGVATAIWALWSAVAATAQGESRWSLYGPTDAADLVAVASICPVLDSDVTGNYFCVSLGCRQGGVAEWRVDFVGAGDVPAQLVAQIGVDNLGQTPIPMRRADAGGGYGYAAPFDPGRDAALLAALGRGGTGMIGFDTPWLTPRSFALAGADAAIQTALARCPVADAPAAGGTAASPARSPREAILAEVAGFCGVAPARLGIAAGFETRADITGDGVADLIYNYGALSCPDGRAAGYCGSGGCTHAIWAGQASGGHREVFRDTIYSMTADWMPVLHVEVHGSACGGTGASGPCRRSFRIAPDGTLSRLD
jgi:hypothetical protein